MVQNECTCTPEDPCPCDFCIDEDLKEFSMKVDDHWKDFTPTEAELK